MSLGVAPAFENVKDNGLALTITFKTADWRNGSATLQLDTTAGSLIHRSHFSRECVRTAAKRKREDDTTRACDTARREIGGDIRTLWVATAMRA